jgi:hypothetical protein
MELAQDRVQWQALALALLNLRVLLPEIHYINFDFAEVEVHQLRK